MDSNGPGLSDDVSFTYQPFLAVQDGRVAQLGERVVRNDEVAGSIPVTSTIFLNNLAYLFGFDAPTQIPAVTA